MALLASATVGWVVFGVFVALCVVLVVAVGRFARRQSRSSGRRRDGSRR